eukprot:364479-Chlamydomonas_euryale.AAC.3
MKKKGDEDVTEDRDGKGRAKEGRGIIPGKRDRRRNWKWREETGKEERTRKAGQRHCHTNVLALTHPGQFLDLSQSVMRHDTHAALKQSAWHAAIVQLSQLDTAVATTAHTC